MTKIILFNKPFQVLSQFTDSAKRATLADYLTFPDFYPAGRLDFDSEGLLLLSDDGQFKHRISHPSQKMDKSYWIQVEGRPSEKALRALNQGVTLKDGVARASSAKIIKTPDLWPRHPPIRHRVNSPTTWLELTINEGRNRQVRRMTAAIGHPTLRLIRWRIGGWQLQSLQPGEYREETVHLPNKTNFRKHRPKNIPAKEG